MFVKVCKWRAVW